MAFDLADYQTVQERIEIFWRNYPNGRIVNKIVKLDDKGVVVRCSVWRNPGEDKWLPADAVDFAHENITERGINATSYIENATTSATGRALSLLGGELSPSKKRASRSEMEKMARNRDWVKESNMTHDLDACRNLLNQAKAAGAPQNIIETITARGIWLKENAPVGKETKTTEAQAEASPAAKLVSKESVA